MNKLFKVCADVGDDIISFLQRDKWHAILIGVLCFISPVNLIMWIMILCSLYRKRAR